MQIEGEGGEIGGLLARHVYLGSLEYGMCYILFEVMFAKYTLSRERER
jgi:hypothetical protein